MQLIHSACESADAQIAPTQSVSSRFDVQLDVELNALFDSNLQGIGSNIIENQAGHKEPRMPLQLIGTLVSASQQQAWIKTADNTIFEVTLGQVIPGTTFKLVRIYPDSVDLVQRSACSELASCEFLTQLDMTMP